MKLVHAGFNKQRRSHVTPLALPSRCEGDAHYPNNCVAAGCHVCWLRVSNSPQASTSPLTAYAWKVPLLTCYARWKRLDVALRGKAEVRPGSANLLFYGPPGTGKTKPVMGPSL